jgi:hypothetical protein
MLDCHLYATPIPFSQSSPEFKVCTELTAVLNKALQKEPEKRHQTVEEFGEEFAEAVRRDAIKLKAYRHRMQTSEFMDLASEAQALSKQLYDTGRQQPLAAAQQNLDGVQFVQEPVKSSSSELRRPKTRTDRRSLETSAGLIDKMQKSIEKIVSNDSPTYDWKQCPYCDAPAEPGIRFCLNCKHQFISPEAAAKLKLSQELDTGGGAKGFSKRAKAATATSGLSLPMVQRIVAFVALVIVAVAGVCAYTSGMLAKVVPGLAPPEASSPATVSTPADEETSSAEGDGSAHAAGNADAIKSVSAKNGKNSKRKLQSGSSSRTITR